MPIKKVTIFKIEKPSTQDLNKELQWFSESIGLFGSRDKEKSCFRVFIELIKAKKDHRLLSSDEIASQAHITRATAIHHLKNLQDRGLIRHQQNRYTLTVNDFVSLLEHVEQELDDVFEELKEAAEELNKKIGL